MTQFELITTGHANFEFLSLGSSYEWKLKSGTAGAGGLDNKMLQQTKTIDAKNWKTHPKWNWKKGGVDLCIISVNARIHLHSGKLIFTTGNLSFLRQTL